VSLEVKKSVSPVDSTLIKKTSKKAKKGEALARTQGAKKIKNGTNRGRGVDVINSDRKMDHKKCLGI